MISTLPNLDFIPYFLSFEVWVCLLLICPPVININKWGVIVGLIYNIYRLLFICELFESLLNMNCFQITLGSFFILIQNPMEANQSWSSLKSRWAPQAQNPAVQHELLGSVLLEALSNWTTGTGAHLGIKVVALFPEAFAWAEQIEYVPHRIQIV